MAFKQALFAAGMLMSVFASASPGNAIPLSTFNTGTPEKQISYLTRLVNKHYSDYASNADTAGVAQCMKSLYDTKTPDGSNELIGRIVTEIELAKAKNDQDYDVAEIVSGVISHECPVIAQNGAPALTSPG